MTADIFPLLLKVTAIFALAALIALLLRRASAAWRHHVWFAATMSVIVLAVLQLIVPPIVVRVGDRSVLRAFARTSDASDVDVREPDALPERDVSLSSSSSATSPTAGLNVSKLSAAELTLAPLSFSHSDSGDTRAPQEYVATRNTPPRNEPKISTRSTSGVSSRKSFALSGAETRNALLLLWAFGSFILTIRTAHAHWQLRRIVKSSRVVADVALQQELRTISAGLNLQTPVRLLTNEHVDTPCTAGWRAPMIMLPANFTMWSDARRRAVFTHELAHVTRGDSFAQNVSSIACALFWFHPAAWLAARAMRSESERAADDIVIRAGMPAVEYADHLLALANGAATFNRLPVAALGMARVTQLETRLRAMLNVRQSRGVITRKVQRVWSVMSLLAVVPLAALQARVQEPAKKVAPTFVTVETVTVKASPLIAVPQYNFASGLTPRFVSHDGTPNKGSYVRVAPAPRKADSSNASTNAVRSAQPVVIPPLITPKPVPPPAVQPIASLVMRKDTTFEQELRAAPNEELELHIMSGGSVSVHGWDQPTAKLRARVTGKYWRETNVIFARTNKGLRLITLAEVDGARVFTSPNDDRASVGGSRIRIRGQVTLGEVAPAKLPPVTLDNEFELWVPNKTNIRLESSGGNLALHELQGTFTGSTKLGTITANNSRGEASLTTSNGNLSITSPELTGVIHTGCGSIESNTLNKALKATTAMDPSTPPLKPGEQEKLIIIDGIRLQEYCHVKSRMSTERGVDENLPYGPIEIAAAPLGGALATKNGSIKVGSSAAVLSAITSNGNIDIGRMSGDLTASTGGGNITARVDNTEDPMHNIWIRANKGNVMLELPDSLDATVDIEIAYSQAFKDELKHAPNIQESFGLGKAQSLWSTPRRGAQQFDTLQAGTPLLMRLRGTIGNGRGRIYIRVTDGEVFLKRATR